MNVTGIYFLLFFFVFTFATLWLRFSHKPRLHNYKLGDLDFWRKFLNLQCLLIGRFLISFLLFVINIYM